MFTSHLRLTALTMIVAAIGFAASLAGCASTSGIAPASESTLDDVLSRGPVISSAALVQPAARRAGELESRPAAARMG
jgi:hypothetical protein